MPIDFTSTDKNDENALSGPLKPASTTAWIKITETGAWSGEFSSAKPQNPAGWREVKYATATLNDGRTFRVILNEAGDPISEIGPSTGVDQAQVDRWKNQTQQQSQAERKVVRVEFQGSGADRKRVTIYESGADKVEDYPETGAAVQRPAGSKTDVEGTPDPSKPGGFDNTRPVMVTRGPDGKMISQEPLTAAERQQWEREKNGGRTDAEVAAAASVTPKEEVNPSDPTRLRKPDGKGGWVDAGPNAAGIQAQQQQAAANAPKAEKDGQGNWGYWTKDTPPRWVPIAGGPAGEQPKPVEINGQYGVWKPGPNGTPVWTTVQGPPPERTAEPAGAPAPRMTLGQITQGLQEYSEWLNEQVRLWQKTGGKEGLSPDAATKSMESRRALATSAVQEQQGIINVGVTQRGQTLNEVESRRNAANTTYNQTIGRFIPQTLLMGRKPGGGRLVSNALNATLARAPGYAAQWGGMREVPPVPVGQFQGLQGAQGAGPTFTWGGPPAAPGAAPVAPIPAPAPAAPSVPPVFRPQPPAEYPGATADPAEQSPPPVAPALNPVTSKPITVPVRPLMTPPPPLVTPPPPPASSGSTPSNPPPGMDSSTGYPYEQPPMPYPVPVTPPSFGGDQSVMPALDPLRLQALFSQPMQQQPMPGYQPQPIDTWDGNPGSWDRPTFLSQARTGRTPPDPSMLAMQRIASGANPEIVAAAFEEHYGRPLRMAV